MIDPWPVRYAMVDFLGEELFRKFIVAGVRRGRLRFWQEKEWEKFLAVHPQCAMSLEELEVVLRVCEIHGEELLADSVPVIDAHVDFAPDYEGALIKLFPHAATGPWYTQGAPCDVQRKDVWYCPRCREAKAKWLAKPKRNQWIGPD